MNRLLDEIEFMGGEDKRSREVVIELPADLITDPPRDPIVDLFVSDGWIHVTTEFLGIDEKSIQVQLKDRSLVIHATGGADIHTREIWLPVAVEKGEIKKRYKNGVLEVALRQRPS
ncbi:MAG: Hsp20/alpha crystallin family protein [Candidatus Syntropharchaeales archaeon]